MEEPSSGKYGCSVERVLCQRLFLVENEVMAEGEIDEHAPCCTEEKSNDSVMTCQRPETEKSQHDTTVYDEAGQVGQYKTAPLMVNLMALAATVPECPVTI